MDDWITEIVVAHRVIERLRELDTRDIWDYHLAEVAANSERILAAERHLGLTLDERYRAFLGYADGWKSFYQSVDIFGTTELVGGPVMVACETSCLPLATRSSTSTSEICSLLQEVRSRKTYSC